MTQPVMLAVDDDGEVLARLEQALRTRFGADYQILVERSAAAGLQTLERLRDQAAPVAMILAHLLDRNAIPYQFHPHDSQAGQRLLRQTGQDGIRLPVMVLFAGRVLVDPTNAEGAAIGIATQPEPGPYDLIVVGAGPAGLSAATCGASEGSRTAR